MKHSVAPKNEIPKKRLYQSILSILLAFVTLVSVTIAWLVLNRHVDSSGMQMTMEMSSNLVISAYNDTDAHSDGTGIAQYLPGGHTEQYIRRVWTNDAASLIPVTHKLNSATGLEYNTNSTAVDRVTGFGYTDANSARLAFADVPVNGAGTYFVDYVVYLASTAKPLPDVAKLKTTMTLESDTDLSTLTPYQATSVDFYAGLVNANAGAIIPDAVNYKGTLNLKSGANEELDLAVGTAAGGGRLTTIPLNTSQAICVYMRCYFDGALEMTPGKAYVNSNDLNTLVPISFRVSFEVEQTETD